jgi:two-component system, NtrC family, response regulator GlrR
VTSLILSDPATGELLLRTWKLEVIAGPDQGATLTRDHGSLIIGTQEDADLVLTDPAVSRRHLQLELFASGVRVIDLGSKNGTRVGGEKIDNAFVLSGSVLKLGKTELELRALDSAMRLDQGESRFGEIVTAHPPLQRTLARLAMVARSCAPILLEGERGTGKETIARAIHHASNRRDRPFQIVCCAELSALPASLAQPGTLLLDDVAALKPELQLTLIAALDAAQETSPRLIATTREPLEPAVADKRFRADLYYQLAVIRARIPPLVERPEDMPIYARAIAARHHSAIEDAAIDALARYDFPGNIDELDRVLVRACARAGSGVAVRPDHLFAGGEEPSPRLFHEEKDRVVTAFEARYVRALLSRHAGNVSAAAKEAHLARNALYALMKRAGLD